MFRDNVDLPLDIYLQFFLFAALFNHFMLEYPREFSVGNLTVLINH